jgi:DNA polymerase-3 subunit alpha
MAELVQFCQDNNIPYGFCRGSIGGSLIAYITDITDVNPIIWDTIFSRFCNADRISLADIDIDFAPEDRIRVYEWIINKLTPAKTSYIAQFGTLKDRGTIETIARGLGWNNNKDIMMAIKNEYEDIYKEYIECLEIYIDFDLIPDDYKIIDFDNHEFYLNQNNNINFHDNLNKIKIKFENYILRFPEIAYYFKGIKGTIKSKGSHPAGIIGSPISLTDNIGVFYKDGNTNNPVSVCAMKAVDYLNFVKFDILGLKTIGIIKDVYNYIGSHYLQSHEIDWNDKNIWDNTITSKLGMFQFEGSYAFDLLKQFKPQTINDMSLVNAALRPSGKSYRDKLMIKEFNQNPSDEINDLLKDNYGYLVYQEDTIKFLTNICGFSGALADTTRRCIGKKDIKGLNQQLPLIIDGYCKNCDKPRDVAENEVNQFIQIISDSSDYQFGYNHSTGYSMNGYACVRLRTYYPLEFLTAYLNRAENEEDIINGTQYAIEHDININMPIFGNSHYNYSFDKKSNTIYKGLKSIKYLNHSASQQLYELGQKFYCNFLDLLIDLNDKTVDKRQLVILTKLNYFSEFGNNQKLLHFITLFNELYYAKSVKQMKYQYDIPMNKIIDFNTLFSLLEQYSKKTDKTFKDIDNYKLLSALWDKLYNIKMPFPQQAKDELEYLGYIQSTEPKVPDNLYFVIDLKTFQNQYKPYLNLYKINNGDIIHTKIINDVFYQKRPFKQYAIIEILSETKEAKNVRVNGAWKKSKTDFDNILIDWNVCYNQNINAEEKVIK